MIKKFFSALALVLFATSVVAQSGLTCDDPIPVDKNYVGTIPAEGEYWFTAYTYDLPLNVHFSPLSDNSDWGPEVYVDFTCIPGVYEDHKLDSVINGMTDFGLELPVEFLCDRVVRNGKVEWDLSINENYRENLTRCGITENVQAFVRVYFSEPGEIRLSPDTSYQSCMENERVKLGDTLEILPNDADRVFILPYSEWKKDSIQFTWIGDGSVDVWVSDGSCEFTPISTSAYVKARYTSTATQPHKLQPADIDNAVQNWLGGGVYFAKVMASRAGKLVVEKIPLGPIQGDAILLKHGESVQLNANDERVFCFPKAWKSTEFITTTSSPFEIQLSSKCDFSEISSIISTYSFGLNGANRILQLSSADISALGENAIDDYLYVSFHCNVATVITPTLWDASSCANQSILLSSGVTKTVLAKSSSTLYRLVYDDWKDADFSIKWTGNSTLPIYFARGCNFMLNSVDPDVALDIELSRRSSYTITSQQINKMDTYVDEQGLLYVRFNPTGKGNVTFTSLRPSTPDPVYTTISETLCYGESYTWNGQEYTLSGEYQQALVAANGADSIVTLNLTVLPELKPTTEEVTVEYGESYTWKGVEYAVSGSYTDTLKTIHGCDSVVTLNLTILPNPEKTELFTNDNLVLNLASAFKVYSMDHLAWVAQDVTLNWGGSTPLYVFIAKNKDFALTPYNRYVIHYEEIAAGGSWVLTKEQMASWAAYADADVQLYVRFLTEFEGELIVK